MPRRRRGEPSRRGHVVEYLTDTRSATACPSTARSGSGPYAATGRDHGRTPGTGRHRDRPAPRPGRRARRQRWCRLPRRHRGRSAFPPVRRARDAGLLEAGVRDARPMFERLVRDGVRWSGGTAAGPVERRHGRPGAHGDPMHRLPSGPGPPGPARPARKPRAPRHRQCPARPAGHGRTCSTTATGRARPPPPHRCGTPGPRHRRARRQASRQLTSTVRDGAGALLLPPPRTRAAVQRPSVMERRSSMADIAATTDGATW
ncbi:hypothetical protein F558DRAFT_03678 [Streptomyces sp. AmelKG-A3]|nr:hypothetical protein GA0115247_107724 [Streptomyces sp. PalvLS-984]SDD24862.1 hypothetical protein F558DRAFT_03678 [Streptomyces sp. AmelKG-A3]